MGEWFVIVDTCVKFGWLSPDQLARTDAIAFNTFIAKRELKADALLLRKAAVLAHADVSAGSSLALKGASGDAELLLTRLKAVDLADSAVRKDVSKSMRKLRLPKNFSELGPTAKLAKLRQASANKDKINRFPMTSAHMNALTGIIFRFQSFASSIRCYYSFCELRGNPPFPVREAVVIEWSSIFNQWGTFRNYINYLKKACYYLDQPATWYTPALVNIAKGLKLVGKAKYRFPNFIDISLLVRIIKHETRHSEFAQLSYDSFLFALRVPSETIQLVWAYKGDQLNFFYPHAERALIGLRAIQVKNAFFARFNRRKNLPQ